MDAERRKEIWAIIQAVGSIYGCILATWVVLHPTGTQVPPVQGTVPVSSPLSGPQWVLISAFSFFALMMAGGAISTFISLRRGRKSQVQGKLEIHSAVYGTGPENDKDVTGVLQKHSREALAFEIENNSFGFDPAPMRPKRLEVEYSYGNRSVKKIARPEGTRLIVPEDQYANLEIQRLANRVEELARQLTAAKAAALTTAPQLPLQLPRIVPVRYGKHSDGHYGLFIENSGEPAFDVSVSAPVAIGEAKLVFDSDFPNLSKADGTVLLRAYIEKHPHDIDLGDLFEAMRSRGVASIEFPIRYKDGDNNHYITYCKIERDPTRQGGLAVRFVGQERASSSSTTASSVGPNDPSVIAKVSDNSQGTHRETVFTLTNVGRSVAHRVQVRPWNAKHGGSASFREFPLLEVNQPMLLKPEVGGFSSPLQKHDLWSLMHHEWEAQKVMPTRWDDSFAVPFTISYGDLSGAKFETSFDLTFYPGESTSRAIDGDESRIILEAKNFFVRKVGNK
jgi:hypothetical protein